MQRTRAWPVAGLALAGVWLAGYTARPAERGLLETHEVVTARDTGVRAAASQSPADTDSAVQALLAKPLSAGAAVQISIPRNPGLK